MTGAHALDGGRAVAASAADAAASVAASAADDDMATFPAEWIDRVRAAERSGELVVAYDLATEGLKEHPDNVDLRYLATRALVRSGAVNHAAETYERFRLGRERNTDIASLGARITKDAALAAPASKRRALLTAAAAAYARIYARAPTHYPAVNAATLYLLAGDNRRARGYARRGLEASYRGRDHRSLDRYYRLASRAEAALILGDAALAREALRQSTRYLGTDFDAAATTRRQLRLVCRATDENPALLDVIRPPAVLHYCGPVLAGDGGELDRRREQDAVDGIAAHLANRKIGFAYGALSAGAEILCAQACLRVGVELHIVLPFNKDEFAATMVRPAGPRWLRRFKTCLDGAKSVTFATADSYQGDNGLFTYASRLAMGVAILRAQHLGAAATHLKVDNGGWEPDRDGYAANLRMWHAHHLSSHRIAPTVPASATRVAPKLILPARRMPPRFSRALLFGDVKGFSRTPDYLIPVFQERLMGAIAGALRAYDRHVLYRNSWGDAIYAVIDDPVVAAECCLAIQDAIRKARPTRYGLSPELALRLAAHFGPVYDGHDPIRDEPTFFGAHTTIAARMEPVTAPGQVYLTEAMAAVIAMANVPHLRAEYVGNTAMAKGFGSTRMYSLNRVA
jgi:tetratricopeptide (TPR) repeat protein